MQKKINQNAPSAICLAALLLYCAAASALLPILVYGDAALTGNPLFSYASFAMPTLGLLLCGALTRSLKPMIPFGIITAIIFIALGVPRLAATLPLLFTLVSIAAYVCLVKTPLLLVPIGIAAYLPAFFVLGDHFLAAFALLALPAGYLLYRANKAGAQRVEAVCKVSAALGVFIVIIVLAELYFAQAHVAGGSFDLEALRSYFENLRADLTSEIANALHLAYEQVLEGSLSLADATEIASLSVATVFNYFPAICVILLLVLSYVIHSLYIALTVPVTDDVALIKNAITFKMSVTSAVLFIVALIASACLDYDGEALYSAVAKNIYAILIPGLTLIFFGFVGALARGTRASCLGVMVYISLFGLLIYLPAVMLPLAALGGALVIIITEIKLKLDKKNNGNNPS